MSRQKDLRLLQITKGIYINEEDKKKSIFLKFDPETRTVSPVSEPISIKENKEIVESDIASSGSCRAKSVPGRKRDPIKWSQVIKLFKEGKKQCEMADEVGVSTGTIS